MADDPTVATLEGLLAQFETGTATPPLAQPAPSPQEQDSIQRHARDAAAAEEQHQRNLQTRSSPSPDQALAQAVRGFKSGGLEDESDELVEGYIFSRARRDAAFNEAVSSGDAEQRRPSKPPAVIMRRLLAATTSSPMSSAPARVCVAM